MDHLKHLSHPQGCRLCHEPAGTMAICSCQTDCSDYLCGAAMVCEPGWRL